MFKKEVITSFESVEFKLSGMRFTNIYEIFSKDGKAELSLYNLFYGAETEEDRKRLEKRVVTDNQTIIDLLNKCNIIKWDGFSGANPRGVRDGYMFTFIALLNDGKRIYANGSNNFPKHYHDFTNKLTELLSEG